MLRVRHSTTPHWPFWLLIAAWVCANSPQAATYAVLTWLAEAPSFSHQQRLSLDVAQLFTGEALPAQTAFGETPAHEDSSDFPANPVPASAVLKKIDLTAETMAALAPLADRKAGRTQCTPACHDTLRAPPPHGPPRASAVS
jgi:hypothetical protein